MIMTTVMERFSKRWTGVWLRAVNALKYYIYRPIGVFKMNYRPQYVGCVRTERVHHVYSHACWQRVPSALRKTRANNNTHGSCTSVVTIGMYGNVSGIVNARMFRSLPNMQNLLNRNAIEINMTNVFFFYIDNAVHSVTQESIFF